MKSNKFGSLLRQARQKSSVTIDEICQKMGWSKSYLMDVETGRSAPPSKDKIRRFCLVVGCWEIYLELLKAALADKGELKLAVNDKNLMVSLLLLNSWDDINNKDLARIESVLNEW